MTLLKRVVSFSLLGFLLWAQQKPSEKKYAMTTYYLCLLNKGPQWSPQSTPEVQKIQEGHMANIRKMADTGKLVVAGPITDNGTLRGIFIFAGSTLDEVKAMVQEDPAIQSGRLSVEIHPWLAGKGLKVDQPQ